MNNFFENSKNLKKVLILLKNNYDGMKQITGCLINNISMWESNSPHFGLGL